MRKFIVFISLCLVLFGSQVSYSSTYKPKITNVVVSALNLSLQQYKGMVAGLKDSSIIPRRTISATNTGLYVVGPTDWTSGFFSGILWYLYEYSGDQYWRGKALSWTNYLKPMKSNTQLQHDIGFVMNCSFGNAFRLTNNPEYVPIMVESGTTLSKRFSPVVNCFKSWDSGNWAKPSVNIGSWNFPVIIDNMMNLELELKAFLLTQDSSYYKQACLHANTTILNHIRPDSTIYHVIDYYKYNGKVIAKGTRQGYSDMSCWARGQAWGIYGFTTMYKYTNNPIYLQTAKMLLGYYLKNRPDDYVPFWDYDDPSIPNTYKDASAAAITASALIDLYQITNDSSYLQLAEGIIQSLASPAYTNSLGTNSNFILAHSTGGCNGYEANVSQTYADYYYVEALVKYLRLDANYKFTNHAPEINSATIQPASIGAEYSNQIELFDLDNDILSVSCTGLPKGLTINSSGLISGMPTQSGIYNIVLKVTDGKQVVSANRQLSVGTSTNVNKTNIDKAITIYNDLAGHRLIIKSIKETDSKTIRANLYSVSGQLMQFGQLSFENQLSYLTLPPNCRRQILTLELVENNHIVSRKKVICK